MNTPAGLAGLGVLVTRPAHQAQAQMACVENAGGRPVPLPLLSIAGPPDPAAARAALQAAHTAAWWVFTSPNAVRWAAQLAADEPAAWPARLAAAGRGTAAALAALGRTDAYCPAMDGAAGLLALPELAALTAGAHVAVLCGAHNPPWLASGLQARGIRLQTVHVYRRVRVAHDVAQVTQALAAVDAAIVTSGEALEHLCALTPASVVPRLHGLKLALPSARVVEMARTLGFGQVPLVPQRVSDEGFVQALVAWRNS
ncbi:MAG: uroporphyrinogen-III synthase [Nevskiaceae bacterium]|nr:MAG: uroporphyrinogen-III synthase [Nevskiaceae bacterium]TBR71343.1 MAG: uroporphyrinogen-III synthase [Nevskiaceae bacterium]